MTVNAGLHTDAVTWVQTLQARGVRLHVHGKKGLSMVPKSAYGEMSAEERATLKAHKAEIVSIVRKGTYAPMPTPSSAHAEPPAPCPHCYRAPCIGERHPAYDTLHPLTERQLFERGVERAKKELAEMKLRLHYGLPSPTWDL